MHGIFTCIQLICMVNIGKYTYRPTTSEIIICAFLWRDPYKLSLSTVLVGRGYPQNIPYMGPMGSESKGFLLRWLDDRPGRISPQMPAPEVSSLKTGVWMPVLGGATPFCCQPFAIWAMKKGPWLFDLTGYSKSPSPITKGSITPNND